MSNPNLNNNKETLSAAEKEFENNIRPREINDFSGQARSSKTSPFLLRRLKCVAKLWTISCFMARPVLGKTTLEPCIVANELGVNIKETSGPVIEKPGDLAGLLTNLEPRDVLFIDEIHRLSTVVEEYLYAAHGRLPHRYYDR